MFSSERIFSVQLANGEEHKGIASVDFFWTKDKTPLVASGTTETREGFIAGRILEDLDAGQIAVEVPDGEVLALPKAKVEQRPTEIQPPSAKAV